ncbi:MAG: hypothetical protein HY700_10590 [Gemmatimonadetes bacterium]|nr:hypothetical protein [Gemmatimonadota bacterium]
MRRFGLLSLLFVLSVGGMLACDRERAAETATATPPAAPAPAAVTVADTGATLNPPAELDMEQQHHAMMMIGRDYDRLVRAVSDGDKANATKYVKEMTAYVDRVPRFMIHVPDVAPDSLEIWARKLKGQLLRVDELVKADSMAEAKKLAIMTVQTCSQCHAKYQAPMPG